MKLETAGAGHIAHHRVNGPGERSRNRFFSRLPLPDGHGLAVGALNLRRCVFTPPHGDGDAARFLRNEETEAHRRWEEAFLSSLALFVRLFGEARPPWDLTTKVVILVGVGALLGRRARWDQKAGQVPIRWTYPARQPLVGEWMARPRADEIELQRLDQPLAHLQGAPECGAFGSRGHMKRSSVSGAVGARFAASFLLPFSATVAPDRASSLARSALSSRRRTSTSSRTSSGQRYRQGFFLLPHSSSSIS